MKAQTIVGAVEVLSMYDIGQEVEIETTCADFDAYIDLPVAITCDGLTFGKKGWNSDKCRAYYGTDKKVAIAR